jgi:hypothetical protein
MKNQGMAFGSKGPEGGDKSEDKANELEGAKGGGMKHVVSPGADGGQDMQNQKKHMMMIALLRAMQAGQGGSAPGGAPMGGGSPMSMGQPPMAGQMQ